MDEVEGNDDEDNAQQIDNNIGQANRIFFICLAN